MSAAQPTPEELDWASRERARSSRRSGRAVRPVDRPATSESDVVDLVANQRRLDETIASLVDDVEGLQDIIGDYARAVVAWEVHKGAQTKRLDDQGVRHSEDLRLAYALAYSSPDGTPGRELYRRFIEAKTRLDAFQIALKAKGTIASGTQTLLNHAARASGLD